MPPLLLPPEPVTPTSWQQGPPGASLRPGEERLLILKVRLEAETMMLLEDHQQAEAEAEE